MGVGYHKINTSAARSSRRQVFDTDAKKPAITPANSQFTDPTFGRGKTDEDFVSDCDNVWCSFDDGTRVKLRGGGIRYLMSHGNDTAAKE